MPVYQFIFIKGQGPREAQSKRKTLLLLIDLVGRDQRIKGFVPALEGKADSPIFYTILIEVARKGELERAFF
jgi:hypothetical protein